MPSKNFKSILVGIITLDSRNQIRVHLDEYEGRKRINLRHWYINYANKLVPTKQGIAPAIKHLPALNTLVRKARKRAEADGLLAKKMEE